MTDSNNANEFRFEIHHKLTKELFNQPEIADFLDSIGLSYGDSYRIYYYQLINLPIPRYAPPCT